MYPHINQVQASGRLTKDPESKYMQSGILKVTMSVALNNRRKQGTEWRNAPAYIIVECWEKVAENIAARARKGQPIFFTGQVTMDSWERDGEKKSMLKFTAHSVMLLTEDREPAKHAASTDNDFDEGGWDDDDGINF